MILEQYLSHKKISQAGFARLLKKPAQTIGRYINGERIPEPEIMRQIADITGGLVTANDFYGLSASKGKSRN